MRRWLSLHLGGCFGHWKGNDDKEIGLLRLISLSISLYLKSKSPQLQHEGKRSKVFFSHALWLSLMSGFKYLLSSGLVFKLARERLTVSNNRSSTRAEYKINTLLSIITPFLMVHFKGLNRLQAGFPGGKLLICQFENCYYLNASCVGRKQWLWANNKRLFIELVESRSPSF